jgi:hypothetical protein
MYELRNITLIPHTVKGVPLCASTIGVVGKLLKKCGVNFVDEDTTVDTYYVDRDRREYLTIVRSDDDTSPLAVVFRCINSVVAAQVFRMKTVTFPTYRNRTPSITMVNTSRVSKKKEVDIDPNRLINDVERLVIDMMRSMGTGSTTDPSFYMPRITMDDINLDRNGHHYVWNVSKIIVPTTNDVENVRMHADTVLSMCIIVFRAVIEYVDYTLASYNPIFDEVFAFSETIPATRKIESVLGLHELCNIPRTPNWCAIATNAITGDGVVGELLYNKENYADVLLQLVRRW